ncbi:MAG: hypothetical protein ACOC04_00050 [Halothece sp.]
MSNEEPEKVDPDNSESEIDPKEGTREVWERQLTREEIKGLQEDIDQKREDTRTNLALRLIWLLIGTYIAIAVIGGWIIFKSQDNSETIYAYSKDLFSLLITTQTGLVGTVVGFYFGINQSKSSGDQSA